jgi:echinoderm microtubule-associated protein-like 1/2
VKFFLRGRPVTLHLPSSLQSPADSHSIGFDNTQTDVITNSIVLGPRDHLKLEWVYGYRGKDCRSNIYALGTGECVYFMAGVCVLYNVNEDTQRHYIEHTDDIKSLAVHPDKVTIATGQCTGHGGETAKAHVRIWDAVTLNTLKVIGLANGDFNNAVCCLSFSKTDGGAMLCCVDDANDKWLSVWQWQSGTRVAATKCYGDLVFAAEFHPTQPNLMVTCGKQHIIFWHVDPASQHLVKRSGIFDGDKPKYVLCVAFYSNGVDIVVSGDSDGNILFWNVKENRVTHAIKNAHDGGVFAIMTKDQTAMITGGKDGSLVEWTCTSQSQQQFERHRTLNLPEQSGSVRFMAPMSVTGSGAGGGGGMFLVGTTRNSIYQVSAILVYYNTLIPNNNCGSVLQNRTLILLLECTTS